MNSINKEFRVSIIEDTKNGLTSTEVYDLSETQLTEHFKLYFKRMRNKEILGITIENSLLAESEVVN